MRARLAVLALSSLLSVAMTLTAFSAKSPSEKQRFNRLLNLARVYSMSDEQPLPAPSRREKPEPPQNRIESLNSPGTAIGYTWYDQQRNGSMRRMISWGTHGDPDTMIVHFHWMFLPDDQFYQRAYMYTGYNAATGTFCGPVAVQPDTEYAGYVVLDVTNDNRAILGGHNTVTPIGSSLYQSHFYWDSSPGACNLVSQCRVPDGGPNDDCAITPSSSENGHIWPAMCWQEGMDTVLHVMAQESEPDAGDPQSLIYLRGENPEQSCTWTSRCLDTVYTLSQDCDCTDDGKVILGWTANRVDPSQGCDTCSCDEISCPGYVTFSQWDNDLYYQISNDGGLTWEPRVNVTQHTDSCETGVAEERPYRPFIDVSVLIDSKNDAHIVWAARSWPGDANCGGNAGLYRGRIFHYSEDNPYIRTVHNAEWDQQVCSPGGWRLNACKQTVSECDSKLYVLFVQLNDGPASIYDDCAAETQPNFPEGAANGDLYVTISADYGLTWDEARNLTNTRMRWSDGDSCDYLGGPGGRCPAEHWPSMAKYGSDYVGDFTGIAVVDPSGNYTGDYFLDVQYIDDYSAGSITKQEGYWQQNDVRWFRLACVDPLVWIEYVPIWPFRIGYPCWTKHGVQKDTNVILQNPGNETLIYAVTEEEDTGPDGWLSTSGFSGSIPPGMKETDTGTIHLNTGGIVNDPGTIVYLSGRLIFNSNAESSPDTLPIECWVADTLIEPVWDTVFTVCDGDTVLGLTVANTGNFGNQGDAGVTMDYSVWEGDTCEDAEVYLYDGSPVIGYTKNGDTIANYSIYSETPGTDNGFIAAGTHTPTADSGDYEVFESGKIVTRDSLIALEKTWYAPKAQSDSCSFVIECIRIYQNTDYKDTTVTGVRIGEAIDWDIPSDSSSDNASGFDAPRRLIYQQGVDYGDDGVDPCYNDKRFGGMDFLGAYCNDDSLNVNNYPHGAYTLANSRWVFPSGGFVPEELCANMDTLSGYRLYTDPDSPYVDLHMVMTFDTGLVLTGDTVYTYYIGLCTHWNADYISFLAEVDRQIEWYKNHVKRPPQDTGCCNHDGIRGDINANGGGPGIADLTYLVDYLFRGGPTPPCRAEANADGDPLEQINVADLTYLVDFLFRGGPVPPPCP